MKIGIVCDDYKLSVFLDEIKSRNIIQTHKPFTKGVTAIFIYTTKEIASEICTKCEAHFTDIKAKNN